MMKERENGSAFKTRMRLVRQSQLHLCGKPRVLLL